MPGKYLEFIRAGRYVVPVELSFLPTTYLDLLTSREVTTTKWVERRHWKEIKALLKPAVETVAKYNENSDKISKSHHLELGQELLFGYIIHLNKDKSPFIAVLDCKKNVWTDDEDGQETDENTDLTDYGGRHKNYTVTKCYIKACVIKKSGSVSEDGIKLRKELGVKKDDVRNYFKPSSSNSATDPLVNSTLSGPSVVSHHEKNKSSKASGKKKDKARNKDGHHHHRKRGRETRGDLSSNDSLMDLPPPISHTWGINDGRNFGDYQSANQATIIRGRMPDGSVSGSSFGLPGSFTYAEKDDEDSDDSDSEVEQVVEYGKDPTIEEAFKSNFFRNWDEEEEEDDESLPELPDIEETNHPVASKGRRGKKVGGPRKKSAGDRSPVKHLNINTGLPDIDDGHLGRATKATKGKKKRSVAIVEPMKQVRASSSAQVSFEEAIGAFASPTYERRKKGRNNMSSPTIDRLPGASRSKNSAIEIISEDSDLLPFAESRQLVASAEKKKKKNGGEKSPRKRRKKKPADTSIYDRLTPSPFPESPEEGEQNEEANNESDSEPEMPVLVKMVTTSEEERDKEDVFEDHPVNVPPLERIVIIDANGQEIINQNDPIVQDESIVIELEQEQETPTTVIPNQVEIPTILVNDTAEQSTSPKNINKDNVAQPRKKRKKLLKRRSKTAAQEKNPQEADMISPQNNSDKLDTIDHQKQPVRPRYASDSDDITAESGYRKTPLKKKKRKKVIRVPESVKDANIIEHLEGSSGQQIISQRRSTGDAQTQTVISGTLQVPESPETVLEELEIEVPNTRSTTKTERPDDNQSYDSDYANGAFSNGDDDDVLFEGQFQANLHLPALGSPEEGRDELDLFSFENPASVPYHSSSIEDGALAPALPLIGPMQPEPPIENDDINYSFDLTAPPASNTVTIDGSYSGSSTIVRSFQHSSEGPENDGNEVQVAPYNTLGSMSIYQLINHPGTLKAGFGLFNQLASKRINVDEVHKRLGLKNKSKSKKTIMDSNLMPPPPTKRPVSPDICSLNPEKRLRRWKPKKGLDMSGRGSPQPGPSNSNYSSRYNGPTEDTVSAEENFDEDSGEDNSPDGEESLFRELMTRTQQCDAAAAQYEPQGDEFDLSQRSHCMLGVVPQYAEKSRRYKMHAKKIKNITIAELKEHFELIKADIQGIFDGRIICFRSSLYCSKNQHDKALLRSINVNFPFEDVHGKALSTYLFNLLLPQPGSRLKYTDYINYVMLPESFIRIYSRVNSVCYEMAEKEMRCGGVYDDPLEI